jgi:heme exporter protein CcmD
MKGHGGFVWSAYAISIAVMIWLVLRSVGRHRRLLKAIGQQSARGLGES